MRYGAFFLVMFTIFIGCSKEQTKRTNFAEITVGGEKFVFDSLEAVFDTSTQGITCNFRIYNRTSHSYMEWETLSSSKWINGTYQYPGQLFPDPSVVYLNLQTYTNWVPGTYALQNNFLILKIDESENLRMHGTLSGKVTCYTCTPYGIEVKLTGEFEMPYSYR